MPFLIWFLFITGLCLIPFGLSAFYFVLGMRSFIVGRKEKSRPKIIGAYNTLFFSALAMVVVYFLSNWLCRVFLNWEL
jgi:hypothetical protein